MFIAFDMDIIKSLLTKVKYPLPKTQKMKETLNEILTTDIKKSRLNMDFLNNNNKSKNEKKIKNEDEDDIELTKEEIENNFYVQATKETFDDLLLGTEENDFDEIEKLTNEEGENKPEKKMYRKKIVKKVKAIMKMIIEY